MSRHVVRKMAHLGIAVALAACTAAVDQDSVAWTPSTPASESQAPSASVPAAATPAPTASGPTALEVDWTLPFTVTAPPDWTTDVPEYIGTTRGETLWLATGQRFMAFTRGGPETVDSWIEAVTTADQLVASEPVPIEIGTMPGYRVDLEVSDEATADRCATDDRCFTLFQDESGYWPVVEGRPTAAWFVDVDGETIAIVTDSRADSFDDWATEVEEVLSSLEWGE